MKIATFNVNNINKRFACLATWLGEAQPDIVCLQELKASQDQFPHERLRELDYQALWNGQKTWNGVAILSRGTAPLQTMDQLPGDTSDLQSRYLEAAVNGILIACIYLPNGNPQPGPKFDYKLKWFERLISRAAELRKVNIPVVLAGDFNVVPADADIYPTRSWDNDALLQPQSRAAFRRLLDQGWTDGIRAIHPSSTIYTYWDYKRNRWPRDAGLRLDHLLLSAKIKRRLLSAGVDRWVRGLPDASDHAPAWIELKD